MSNREKYELRQYDASDFTAADFAELQRDRRVAKLFRTKAVDAPVLVYEIALYLAKNYRPHSMPNLPGVMRGGDIHSAMVHLSKAAHRCRKELVWLTDESDEYKFMICDMGFVPWS